MLLGIVRLKLNSYHSYQAIFRFFQNMFIWWFYFEHSVNFHAKHSSTNWAASRTGAVGYPSWQFCAHLQAEIIVNISGCRVESEQLQTYTRRHMCMIDISSTALLSSCSVSPSLALHLSTSCGNSLSVMFKIQDWVVLMSQPNWVEIEWSDNTYYMNKVELS